MLLGQTLQIDIQDLRPILERHLRDVIFRDGQCPEIKEIRGPAYSHES